MSIKEIKKLHKYTKTLKLLYVEDDESTRMSMLKVLDSFFDDIILAVDGRDGLDKFKKFEPDLVITDIGMPNMNGLQMIENIKNVDTKDTCILVISAYGESQDLLKAIRSGVDGYLIKPIVGDLFKDELLRVANKIYASQRNVIEINENYNWNKETKKLSYLLEEIELTKNEILLLDLMTSNINLIYQDELIIEQIWFDSENISGSNVKNLLKRLNDKLPQKLIKNRYAVGYSLIT